MKWFQFLLAASALCLSGAVCAEELERRGTLGIALGNSSEGLVVRETTAKASQALKAGDVLLEINGVPANSISALQLATHQLPCGQKVSVRVRRGKTDRLVEVLTAPSPMTKIEGAQVTYGTATAPSGLRVRTVTAVPTKTVLKSDKGLPAVFMIQGITCQSIDTIGDESNAYGAMIRRLVTAGFVAGFADKPGIGDLTGCNCSLG